MLDAHESLLCSKLCQHNADNPVDSSVDRAGRSWVRIPFKSESVFSGCNFTAAEVVCRAAMINIVFLSLSAV